MPGGSGILEVGQSLLMSGGAEGDPKRNPIVSKLCSTSLAFRFLRLEVVMELSADRMLLLDFLAWSPWLRPNQLVGPNPTLAPPAAK
jgi:hypothetical protein